MARPAVRLGSVALLGAVIAGVGLISLSDRVPILVTTVLGASRRAFHRFELGIGVDLLSRSDIPLRWDTAGHMALWGLVGLVGAFAVGRSIGPITLGLGLVAVSAGVEIAQVLLSATRIAQWSDLAANTVGVASGIVAAGVAEQLTARVQRATS